MNYYNVINLDRRLILCIYLLVSVQFSAYVLCMLVQASNVNQVVIEYML